MPKPTKPVTADEVRRLLADDGPFAQRFRRYEARGEQAEMAEAVARAFGSMGGSTDAEAEPHHLLVEGGTGIGKSVAYLLPAVLFALRNNVRVVVSTNTINLQEQLIAKDIPDLLDVLRGVPEVDVSRFRYAQLKGKANYLCLRRWEAAANTDTASPDDARTLAKTLAWLRETRTGDRAELRLSGAELASWDRMSASGFAMCTGAREGACFYRHARDEAASAHLLVVNHSLLLSNLQVGGSLLPDYDYLIVDEAHNLEAEATRQFGFRVSQATVENLVERLGGVIHGFGTVVRASALEESRKESADLRRDEAQMPLYKVRDEWAQLTAGLARFTAEQRESDEGEIRITPSERAQPAWSALDIAWDGFERSAAEASERADALLREMEDLPPETAPVLEQLKGELSEWMADQEDARRKIRSFVSEPDADTVYWIGRGDNLSLNGAPLDVAPRLRDELFAPKPTVVLTSATLTVAGGFSHVRTRLGVEEPGEVCLGSPFDYKSAALLCLPTDMPEPGDPRYTDAVAQRAGAPRARRRGADDGALHVPRRHPRDRLPAPQGAAAARHRRPRAGRGRHAAATARALPRPAPRRPPRHRVVLGGRRRRQRDAQGARRRAAAVQRADGAHLRGALRAVRTAVHAVRGAPGRAPLPPGFRTAHPQQGRPRRRRRAGQPHHVQVVRAHVPELDAARHHRQGTLRRARARGGPLAGAGIVRRALQQILGAGGGRAPGVLPHPLPVFRVIGHRQVRGHGHMRFVQQREELLSPCDGDADLLQRAPVAVEIRVHVANGAEQGIDLQPTGLLRDVGGDYSGVLMARVRPVPLVRNHLYAMNGCSPYLLGRLQPVALRKHLAGVLQHPVPVDGVFLYGAVRC